MQFVKHLCNILHHYNWHSTSHGPSVIAELVVISTHAQVDEEPKPQCICANLLDGQRHRNELINHIRPKLQCHITHECAAIWIYRLHIQITLSPVSPDGQSRCLKGICFGHVAIHISANGTRRQLSWWRLGSRKYCIFTVRLGGVKRR